MFSLRTASACFVHPKDVDWYKSILNNWAEKNKKKLERTYSRHAIEHLTETVWEDAKESMGSIVSEIKSWPVWGYKNKLLEVADD